MCVLGADNFAAYKYTGVIKKLFYGGWGTASFLRISVSLLWINKLISGEREWHSLRVTLMSILIKKIIKCSFAIKKVSVVTKLWNLRKR